MSVALPHAVRGMLVLVLLTPFVIAPEVFAHFSVSKAIFSRVLIEIMFVGWVFLAFKHPEFRPPRSRVLATLGLYLLASLVAAFWGINADRSLWSTFDRMTGVVDLLHWCLFALVLTSVVRTPGAWRALLNCLLAVSLALSLIALTQAYGYSFIPGVMAKCRVDATLGNPSFLAPILLVSILVSAGLLVRSFLESRQPRSPQDFRPEHHGYPETPAPGTADQRQTGILRGFWLLVIALGLVALILTGTRGAIIGLAAGAVVMPLALALWGNRQALKGTVLASAGILAAVGVLFAFDQTVGLSSPGCAQQTTSSRLATLTTTGTQHGPLAMRLAAWEAGLLGFLERPALGWGPENFGYAFDRHVEPWVFRHGSFVNDKAHNQVLEELTTKGAVGLAAFLFLWVTLVWVIVGRVRPAGEDVLAYAVLGALAGYFVQNLFLFDTPATLMVWLVLLGWTAAQENHPAPAIAVGDLPAQPGSSGRLFRLFQGFRDFLAAVAARPWARGVGGMVLVALLGLSLYSFSLQPYLAARAFGHSSQPVASLSDRLAHAERSFEAFPPMANQTRQLTFLQFVRVWDLLDPEDRQLVREFFAREAAAGLDADPGDAPLLITAILFIQTSASQQETLAGLEPLLQQLQAIAPHRAETHQLLANQALRQGDYSWALEIAREYQARAPGTEVFFAGIEAAAEAALTRD